MSIVIFAFMQTLPHNVISSVSSALTVIALIDLQKPF